MATGMTEVRVSRAFLLRVPGIADDVRGIDWIHLADDHPGEGMRSAASRCLTVGRELVCGWRSTKAVTCAGPNWAKKAENCRAALTEARRISRLRTGPKGCGKTPPRSSL